MKRKEVCEMKKLDLTRYGITGTKEITRWTPP